ncbi:MAG TPA: serine O-acetyltransferase [Acetomicrobium flavidum]|uniref:serine O-acetyltransferase n=1 Tax=Acetomicrobium flavidum TaxID=49896 RepID=UPI002CF481DA|nr:serine O-acetyltransferase [Acetomicrobium flavidum]
MGKIWQTVKSDFQAVKDRDPAIPDGLRGFFEVILCTPGFQAILAHRLIHFLHTRLRIPILPRFLGLIVRWWTGIEIHPGAQIGKGVFIDHGMGVVIGETAIVKDNVTLFHGVTLGGTGKEKGKRHPTVEEGAFIGAGAKILGNITIGKNSKIGAGSVVVKDVPPDSTVVGIPAFMVKHKGFKLREATANVQLANTILRRIEELEQELKLLKEELRNVQDQLSIQNKQEVA